MDIGNKICVGIVILFALAFIWGMISEWKKDEIKKRKRKLSRKVPKLFRKPYHWPNKKAYDKAMKLSEKIMFLPTKLGVMGNTWIINLWLASFILIPLMFPFALPFFLYGLTKHWFWYRLKQKKEYN